MLRLFCAALLLVTANLFSQEKENLSVYFQSNSFDLSETAKNTLGSFFSNKDIVVSAVEIEGFCDDIGTGKDNQVLSQKRAESVAEHLNAAFGIKAGEVTGKGEISLGLQKRDPQTIRSQNRKVSIVAIYSLKTEPVTQNPEEGEDIDRFIGYKTINEPLQAGDKVILRRLMFIGGRTAFLNEEDSITELEEILSYLKSNPEVNFEIHGHVCCITKSFRDAQDIDARTNNLSETRAKKIYDYFLEKGIAPERMVYKGFGRQFPRPNITEKLNKRVEILITKI